MKTEAQMKEHFGWVPGSYMPSTYVHLSGKDVDGAILKVKIQEFFMGHVLPGSQDPYFDRSKIDHMRNQYSRLKFGRAAVENKFKVLKAAVARAFEDTGIDPEQVIEEYVRLKHTFNTDPRASTEHSELIFGGGN